MYGLHGVERMDVMINVLRKLSQPRLRHHSKTFTGENLRKPLIKVVASEPRITSTYIKKCVETSRPTQHTAFRLKHQVTCLIIQNKLATP